MKISRQVFGTLSNGQTVELYTLEAGDLALSLSTLGAAWTSLVVPSARHGRNDVLLGYGSFDGYVHNANYFGVTVGRYANRISGARFSIDGKEHHISPNKTGYSLHGGRMGFSRRIWKAEPYKEQDGVFVRFTLESPDGDQGYPGNLKAAATYGLTDTNQLTACYEAEVDAPCPVNFTNHAYFNLAGEGCGKDVLSTELKLNSSFYVEIDEQLIPTGKLLSVEGTPFDFRDGKALGRDMGLLWEKGMTGYDHCLAVDGEAGSLRPFAEAYEPFTGRRMKGFTTQPGVQVYTGNMLGSVAGKIGSVYQRHGGFCLETEHFPDSPNQAGFPSAIFGPERSYCEKTVFVFDCV